jgi:mRNA interferase MazF
MTPGTTREAHDVHDCDQGDIVLVPFPFTDLSATKRRPVLVLSNGGYNRSGMDFICCGITSNLEGDARHSVPIDDSCMESGFILQPSRIKTDKIVTLERSLIVKAIGKANQATIEKVKRELFGLF